MRNSKLIGIIITFIALFLGIFVRGINAQQGCCSWHDGVSYCDYSTGRYVCNDGTYSPSCTCGGGYNYSVPTTPSCPLMSRYNSFSEQCECYSGYVASGNRCISTDQYCKNEYGFNASYDILDESCECSYGYVFNDSGTSCISGNTACSNEFGNAMYNSLDKTCECSYGYVFNKAGTRCISTSQFCRENFGFNSSYDVLSKSCECDSGYYFDGNECALEQIEIKEETVELENVHELTEDLVDKELGDLKESKDSVLEIQATNNGFFSAIKSWLFSIFN